MTRAEAVKALKERFPGRDFYICAYVWFKDGAVHEPDFSVCVYSDDSNHNNNITSSGRSIDEAVRRCLIAADVSAISGDFEELAAPVAAPAF